MNRLEAALRRAARDLDSLGRAWALVGGLAVSVRAEPRFTRDIDVAVSVAGDEEAESLVRDHRRLGYEVLASVEHDATGRLASVRLQPRDGPSGGVVLDLLFASSGVEPEIVAAAEVLEVMPGLHIPVASTGHLIALKVLARDDARPMDAADLAALLAGADRDAVCSAREALGLIRDRGCNGGRDLAAELDEVLGRR